MAWMSGWMVMAALVVPTTHAGGERGVDSDMNVFGEVLRVCSTDPMTGWKRDGTCSTDEYDRGSHVVCAVVTDAFLAYSRAQGNDLITPNPRYGFPGLKDGDRWCLCATRWAETVAAGVAPPVDLDATSAKALSFIPEHTLRQYATDPSQRSRDADAGGGAHHDASDL